VVSRFRQHQYGFSLVQLMVSMAIATIAIMGVLKVLNLSFKTRNTISVSTDFMDYVYSIRQVINSGGTCTFNLKDTIFEITDELEKPIVVELYYPNLKGEKGKVLAKVGQMHSGLKVVQLELEVIGPIDTGRYLAKLILAVEKNKSTFGAPLLTKDFTFILVTNEKNRNGLKDIQHKIARCYGEHSIEQACSDIGGEYTPNNPTKCNLVPKICSAMGLQINQFGNQCVLVLSSVPGSNYRPGRSPSGQGSLENQLQNIDPEELKRAIEQVKRMLEQQR